MNNNKKLYNRLVLFKTIVLLMIVVGLMTHYVVAQNWKANWISMQLPAEDTTNVWLGFTKRVDVDSVPAKAVVRIAVDSKYWLYINDQLVVFEGGLKRGPNRQDIYYDEVDIAKYLRKGQNLIAVKLWYFGKPGFSHNGSGQPGLLFDLQQKDLFLLSDSSWKVKRLSEYQIADVPHTNFRLPESSIRYDARLVGDDWKNKFTDRHNIENAIEVGSAGCLPWNNLVKRPIPMWKDYGVRRVSPEDIVSAGDTIKCRLPYNMQFTPVVAVRQTPAGQKITMATDNYYFFNGGTDIVKAEYITVSGSQTYENPGWMNGHYLYIVAPKQVEIDYIGYRETGYDTEFSGKFACSDDFFNRLWSKARRTLYVTMRDSYMDCPDRERAQWTGDAVLEAEESFYALSPSSHALARKWLNEFLTWQKPDGTLSTPVPANNWDKELPEQALATVGYYGVWTYYLHTGDIEFLRYAYPFCQRYLSLWEFEDNGLIKPRQGGWNWGDWGDNKDMHLLYNLWYYLALKGQKLAADELGYPKESEDIRAKMIRFKKAFNEHFWHHGEYRNPLYTGLTDDRVHGLAVVSGIAEPDQYKAIERVFDLQYHASPYMEKYIFEAMYQMGLPEKANLRHKKRYAYMVNDGYFSTLFEGWGIGKEGFGGGTVNHAWSGGGLTILSAYMAGIRPLKPGYDIFLVEPRLGNIQQLLVTVPSVKGDITLEIEKDKHKVDISLHVPQDTEARVVIPQFAINNNNIDDLELMNNGTKISSHRARQLYREGYLHCTTGYWQLRRVFD